MADYYRFVELQHGDNLNFIETLEVVVISHLIYSRRTKSCAIYEGKLACEMG